MCATKCARKKLIYFLIAESRIKNLDLKLCEAQA